MIDGSEFQNLAEWLEMERVKGQTWLYRNPRWPGWVQTGRAGEVLAAAVVEKFGKIRAIWLGFGKRKK